MTALEQAARRILELWDEGYSPDDKDDSERHEAMLDMMSAMKRPGWASELAQAISDLAYALPE